MKKGFTLAEVLITIGIIGIVAAITIPSLINNYKNRKYSAILKEDYSILQQISRISKEDNLLNFETVGSNNRVDMENWFSRNIKNNIKIARICYWTESGCWAESMKHPNGMDFILGYSKYFCGVSSIAFVLNNGSSMCIDDHYLNYFINTSSNLSISMILYIDVNGDKSPNVFGEDIFVVVVDDGEFVPGGYKIKDKNLEQNCSKSGSGFYCLTKAIKQNFKFPVIEE